MAKKAAQDLIPILQTKMQRNRQNGFTLIEIMIVIAIFVGMMVISMSGSRKRPENNLKSVLRKMSAGIRLSRDRARLNAKTYRILLDIDNQRVAFQVADRAGRIQVRVADRQIRMKVDGRIEHPADLLPGAPLVLRHAHVVGHAVAQGSGDQRAKPADRLHGRCGLGCGGGFVRCEHVAAKCKPGTNRRQRPPVLAAAALLGGWRSGRQAGDTSSRAMATWPGVRLERNSHPKV